MERNKQINLTSKTSHYSLLGEVNAYFGLLFDGLAKVLLAVGIMTTMIGMPTDFVFSRVLPGLALAVFVGNAWYGFEAYKLSRTTGKKATAIPFGVGATPIFGWLFLIMAPIYWSTNDYVLAWQVGIAAAFIGGLIEIFGFFIAKPLIKAIPNSALLGNLAANGFVWMTVLSFFIVYENAFIALFPTLLLLILHFGKLSDKIKIPTSLLVILIGSLASWTNSSSTFSDVFEQVQNLDLYTPTLAAFDVHIGLYRVTDYLAVILPLQICNFLTTLQCVEAAKSQGDEYNVKHSMLVDGSTTVVGSLFGNPFPTTMYYGHATWKEMGATYRYSFAVGLTYLALCFLGIIGVVFVLIPFEITVALLLLVGLTTCSSIIAKADEEYVIAFLVALVPILAQYFDSVIDGIKASAGSEELITKMMDSGNYLEGIAFLGEGGFITSLLLATFIVYTMKQKFFSASLTMFMMMALTFTGFIHSVEVAWFPVQTKDVGSSYLFIAVVLGGIGVMSYIQENKTKIIKSITTISKRLSID